MVEISIIGQRIHIVLITLPTRIKLDLEIMYEMVTDFY